MKWPLKRSRLVKMPWYSKSSPSSWTYDRWSIYHQRGRKPLLINIFKKGDNNEWMNYHDISLESKPVKRTKLASDQTVAALIQIFALRQLAEEHIQCEKKLVIDFINFKSSIGLTIKEACAIATDCRNWK